MLDAPVVLIVDDQPDIRILFEKLFYYKNPESKFKFSFASSGEEALSILKKQPEISICLTDIRMGQMDGIAFLKLAKELNPFTHVIMMTAFSDTGMIRSAMNGGAYDFLIKPLDLWDVGNTIQRAWGHLQAINQRQKFESRLQTAIETTDVGITITDTQYRILYVNQSEAIMHGYQAHELLGKKSNIFAVHPVTPKTHDLTPWRRERKNKRKDGSVFPVRLISTPIYIDSEAIGRVTVCEDITLEKEREGYYKKMFEIIPVALFEQDYSAVYRYLKKITAGIAPQDIYPFLIAHPEITQECIKLLKIISINPAAVDIYEAKNKEELLKRFGEIFCKETIPAFVEGLAEIVTKGTLKSRAETFNQTLTGKKKYVIVNWVVVDGYEKTWGRVLMSAEDVTELKNKQEELTATKNAYHKLTELTAAYLKGVNVGNGAGISSAAG